MREVSVLLGLMCKYSCEDCVLVIFDADREKYVEVELEKGTILENMAVVLDKDLDNVSYCNYQIQAHEKSTELIKSINK